MGAFLSALFASVRGAGKGHPTEVTVDRVTYSILKLLGEGGYAYVYKAVPKAAPAGGAGTVALKRFVVREAHKARGAGAVPTASPSEAAAEEHRILHEVNIHRSLSGHPNIVKLLAHAILKPSVEAAAAGKAEEVWVAMELAERSAQSLVNDAIQARRKLDVFSEVLPILSDCVAGLAHMHGQPIPVAHWDIKLDNILRGADGRYKLCDFGSASTVYYHATTAKDIATAEVELDEKMTLLYRPPESLDLWEKRCVDTKADIWALGVVLYVLLFLKMPFEESRHAVSTGRVVIPPAADGTLSGAAVARQKAGDELRSLLGRMLLRNPEERPNIYEVSRAVHDIYPAHPALNPPATSGQQPARFRDESIP